MKHLLSAALVLATYWSSALADPPQNFVLHETPREVPEIGFADGQGREVTLEDFRGRTVLLLSCERPAALHRLVDEEGLGLDDTADARVAFRAAAARQDLSGHTHRCHRMTARVFTRRQSPGRHPLLPYVSTS